jgi:hypothetical protein
MKTITITFNSGKVEIKTTGYAGAECLKATEQLEKDLGLQKTREEKTREFYQTAVTKAKVTQ